MNKYISNFGFIILFISFLACKKSVDQPGNNSNNNTGGSQPGNYSEQKLVLSQGERTSSPLVEVSPDTVYTSSSGPSALFTPLPAGFEDKIISFFLPRGYMAVFATNADGTGETACFVAKDSAIRANLPARLRNAISFVRYTDINNPDKKGTATTSDPTVQAFAAQWYYGWSLTKSSFPDQQFVPMTWGKGSCTEANVKYLVERGDVDHLLSFNEPDNTGQSNIPVIDTAVARYQIMQKTGLRLGAPVVTQDQAFGAGRWLTNFMAMANSRNLRIDFIPVHWYDWGNHTNNGATDSITAQNVFNRFVVYMDRVRQAYPGYPLWVTEYNANINRTSEVVHKYFMRLSTEWMNTQPHIERYSYFFPAPLPAINPDNSLTAAGAYWKSLITAKSFSRNIILDATLFTR